MATKAEVKQVENKIPDISNLATKSEIPNVSNFASKAELANVESKIPSTSNFATKSELSEVEGKIPNTDNFATKSELSSVEESIPDTTGLATKTELAAVEESIPSEYVKNASVADNKLTIAKSDNTSIEFASESQIFWVSFDADSVCDKTYAEIKAAYEAGKTLIAKIETIGLETQIGWLSAYYPEDLKDSEGIIVMPNGFCFTWSEPW